MRYLRQRLWSNSAYRNQQDGHYSILWVKMKNISSPQHSFYQYTTPREVKKRLPVEENWFWFYVFNQPTLKKTFLKYKEIQKGAVAKSCEEGLPNILGNAQIFSHTYMRRPLAIHIWLCKCSLLNFLIYEENFIFFFISVWWHTVFVHFTMQTIVITWAYAYQGPNFKLRLFSNGERYTE
jgi:hypothetical protein